MLLSALLITGGLTIRDVRHQQDTALQLQQGATSLQLMLRGVNESAVTQGASSSVKAGRAGIESFNEVYQQLLLLTVNDTEIYSFISGEWRKNWERLRPRVENFLDNSENVDFNDIPQMIEIGKLMAAGGEVADEMAAFAQQTRAKAIEQEEEALHRSVVLAALILLAMGIMYTGLAGTTSRQLRDFENVIADVERQSDLTRRVRATRDDELGHIGRAIDRMLEKFQHSLQEAANASHALLDDTKNLRQVSEKTSADTDAQKDTTAQLSVAMQELVQTLENIAMNVSRTSEAADGTRRQTEESSARASTAMHSIQELTNGIQHTSEIVRELNGKAAAIGTVLDVIRGIAEQTNLLALNAAIEAARAGEQGRGFAVVADEVRMLATRTQDSTREIQDIITQLQQGAEAAVVAMSNDCNRGAAGVTDTTKAMTANEEAAGAVTAITDLIAQIATATEQQHVTAEEINRNLVNINQIAEQTALGAAANSEVSAGIEATARRLDAAVKVFKLS